MFAGFDTIAIMPRSTLSHGGKPTNRARSSADAVFESLRADILGGLYAPGAKLKFAELDGRYHASVSALREALARLAEQRLVDSEPRLGYRVVAISAEDLKDLTWTRIQLETLAVHRAIDEGDVAWESELLAAHHRLDRTQMLTDTAPRRICDSWEEAHAVFHRSIVAGCGSPWLISISDGLRDCSELYRRWAGVRESNRDVAEEHRRIAEAVIARDVAMATSALTDHYSRTLDILLEWLASEGN